MHNRRILLLLASVAAVLTACGTAHSAAPGGATSSGQSVGKSLPGKPLLLGIVQDANQYPLGPITAAANAAARSINNTGGVKGRPVEIVTCDMQGDPNQSVTCVNNLVNQGVVAFVADGGVYAGNAAGAMAQHHVALIGGGTAPQEFSSPVVFPTGSAAFGALAGEGDLAGSLGGKKVAVAGIQAGPLGSLITQGVEKHGGKVVATVDIPVGVPDMSPYVAAATANGVNTIVLNLSPADFPNFMQTMKTLGDNANVVTSADTLDGQVGNSDTSSLEGVYSAGNFIPATGSSDPRTRLFTSEMNAAGATNRGEAEEAVWTSVHIAATAASDTPEITPSTVLAQIPKLPPQDLGIAPPLSFSTKLKIAALGGLPLSVYSPYVFYGRMHNGRIVAVSKNFTKAL